MKILNNVVNMKVKCLNSLKKYKFCTAQNEQPKDQNEQSINSHRVELEDDIYETQNIDKYQKYYSYGQKEFPKIQGFATKEGTLKYSQKKQQIGDKHFRTPYNSDLKLSSVGIGSYVGAPDDKDDIKLFNSFYDSILSYGVNVLDTSINYRYMKSERVLGAVLRCLEDQKEISRNQLFICSKGGYIPDDADNKITGDQIIQNLIQQNKITKEDILNSVHCMHPNFLEDQLNRSLNNLGLETLDLYYLHNTSESQMHVIGEQKYYDKLAFAFEFLEKKVEEGKIKNYGLATWIGLRAKLEEKDIYLSLPKVVEIAKKVGGENNNFNYVMAPCNILMPEIFAEKWHEIEEYSEDSLRKSLVPFLSAARLNKINVITSSPLMQGAMIQIPLPSNIFNCGNLGAKHIQFIRSIPCEALLSTLIGQKTNRHTKTNLEVIYTNPIEPEQFWDFLRPPTKRQQKSETPIDAEE